MRITGIAVFALTETEPKPSNVRCAMSEKEPLHGKSFITRGSLAFVCSP